MEKSEFGVDRALKEGWVLKYVYLTEYVNAETELMFWLGDMTPNDVSQRKTSSVIFRNTIKRVQWQITDKWNLGTKWTTYISKMKKWLFNLHF